MRNIDGLRLAVSAPENDSCPLEERILELERQVLHGAKVHEEQTASIRRLEARLNAYMASQTRSRGDVASNAHAAQETIAQEVRQFIEQRLQNVARNRLVHADGLSHHPHRQQLPRLLGALCSLLFERRSPDFHQLRTLLNVPEYGPAFETAKELYSKVCEFQARSRATDMRCEWIFEFSYGVPLNPDRQEAWPSCDPGQPVLFVVAPAYIVDDQVYMLQRVFTG
ncbi:hypothetical protein ACFWMJ_21085 [Streptomyces hawaiiensis]|uniref:hypothetical protein n=1 Tax=Streptomyces hawaiiensis TaxID=67305 RepID=UPI0036568BFC